MLVVGLGTPAMTLRYPLSRVLERRQYVGQCSRKRRSCTSWRGEPGSTRPLDRMSWSLEQCWPSG